MGPTLARHGPREHSWCRSTPSTGRSGAVWAFWRRWGWVTAAFGFLILCVAQLTFLGSTDEPGGWVNGMHGFLALVILLVGAWVFDHARRRLGVLRASAAAV